MTASRYDMLHPLYGEYKPQSGDVVMFRNAPDPRNQRRQYVVTDVAWHIGEMHKVRLHVSDPAGTMTYDLDRADFLRLDAVKVGRKRK